ncbi:EF-hand domain [Trypanosoma melophagium]|uniref:EF-hand domain n=1 Tax=Trypanosoma melophagium TaxID=715481 RepID=UPI00351A83DB|nr:EF-hand domain [Trypanosoma melophagium]
MSKPKSKGGGKGNNIVNENVTIGGKQLLVAVQDKSRRLRYTKRFEELLKATREADCELNVIKSAELDEVSTLLVGYIARAMGLNLSNGEVLRLVEMIEEKEGASRGSVPAVLLKELIVEALMTGVLGAQSGKKGAVPSQTSPAPISVIRDSEDTIYNAFSVLDAAKRGFLEADEIRHFLRTGAEPFTEEEVEEFIAAAADPENGRIYYEDFADVLATE